jgi:hypothetical protein
MVSAGRCEGYGYLMKSSVLTAPDAVHAPRRSSSGLTHWSAGPPPDVPEPAVSYAYAASQAWRLPTLHSQTARAWDSTTASLRVRLRHTLFRQLLYPMVVIIRDCCSERHRSWHSDLS